MAYSKTEDRQARSRLPDTAALAAFRRSRNWAIELSSISAGVRWPKTLVRIPNRKYVYCFCVGGLSSRSADSA